MNPNTELYKTYRKAGKDLAIEFIKIVQDDFKEAARALGILEDEQIVIDDESDQDSFFDFIIHDFVNLESNQTAVQAYASSDKYKELDTIQKELVDANLKAVPSLYLVKDVDKENNSIKLFDVFNSFKETEIIDIGLSKTLKKRKHYIFMRVLELEKLGMTTGMSSVFDSSKFKKLEKKYLKMSKIMQGFSISHKRTVCFFHLNHTFGLPVSFNENVMPSN